MVVGRSMELIYSGGMIITVAGKSIGLVDSGRKEYRTGIQGAKEYWASRQWWEGVLDWYTWLRKIMELVYGGGKEYGDEIHGKERSWSWYMVVGSSTGLR
jgi:hypothetical protein